MKIKKRIPFELRGSIPIWWPDLPSATRLRQWLPSRGNVVFTLIAFGIFAWAQSVGAVPGLSPQSPTTVSTGTVAYQGRLANPAGQPLTGTYGMIFRLYANASGGSPLWTEQWTGSNSVQVSDGLFNVMLGSLTTIPQDVMTANSNLWLGITVGSDDEMAPRVQIGSVPFSVVASTIGDGGPGQIESWSLGPNQLFPATGANASRVTFDTGIHVEVPQGQTRYYLVEYRGLFGYQYAQRTGSNTSFYGYWKIRLKDGANVVADSDVVTTGYRMLWSAVGGGNQYWGMPVSSTKLVEFSSGGHDIDFDVFGYSDGTMENATLGEQSLQVFELR